MHHLVSQAWKTPCETLAMKLVYMKLCDEATGKDDEDGFVQLSRGRIAKDTGVSERHVTNMITKLTERGLIEVINQGTGRDVTKYRVIWQPLEANTVHASTLDAKPVHPRGDIPSPQATSVHPKGDTTLPQRVEPASVHPARLPDESLMAFHYRVKDWKRERIAAEGSCNRRDG